MRYGIVVSSLLMVGLLVGGAQAQESPYLVALKAMNAALDRNDLDAATAQARAIASRAATADQTKLTGPETYAIGAAHMLIGGLAMEQALKLGGLDAEMEKHAKQIVGWFGEPEVTETSAVTVIGKGEEVDLEKHLVAGKTTIVDFYSEFCGPCKQLAPRLEALATNRQDIAVVKVDINRPGHVGIDWQSPVARQFNLNSIPYLRIYGPDGKLQSEGRPATMQVLQWCQEAQ